MDRNKDREAERDSFCRRTETQRLRDQKRWTLTDKERESEIERERHKGRETCEEKETAQELQYSISISTQVHGT